MRHRHAALAVQGRRRPVWGLPRALIVPRALQIQTATLPQRVLGAPAVSMLPRAPHHAVTVRLAQLTWTRVQPLCAVAAPQASTRLLDRRLALSALLVKLI